MIYAKQTSVSVAHSRIEIEGMLQRARCRAVYTASDVDKAIVGFVLEDRHIKFQLSLPSVEKFQRRLVRGQWVKSAEDRILKDWEQACRQKWRALVLALKSKFVSIEAGVESVEEAFLAQIVLTNKTTVHQWFRAQLEKADMSGIRLLGAGAEP